MTGRYIIHFGNKKSNIAGSKAVDDCEAILKRCGYKEKKYMSDSKWKMTKFLTWVIENVSLFFVHPYSIMVIQHPQYKHIDYFKLFRLLKKIKKVKYVFIIHDLESVRRIHTDVKRFEKFDTQMYELADCIICHNKNMCDLLVGLGIDKNKVVSLEMFDYLVSDEDIHTEKTSCADSNSLVIAGNLAPQQCEYIYSSEKGINYPVNLYGVNFDKEKVTNNALYVGEFSADKLPYVLQGKYGLVWYGNSLDKCGKGILEHYLCYINPHKVSAYIAAGIPVIIGSNVGIADFVKDKKLGVVCDSIQNIREIIDSVSLEGYQEYKKNVAIMQGRIKEGYYLKKAIGECERRLLNYE